MVRAPAATPGWSATAAMASRAETAGLPGGSVTAVPAVRPPRPVEPAVAVDRAGCSPVPADPAVPVAMRCRAAAGTGGTAATWAPSHSWAPAAPAEPGAPGPATAAPEERAFRDGPVSGANPCTACPRPISRAKPLQGSWRQPPSTCSLRPGRCSGCSPVMWRCSPATVRSSTGRRPATPTAPRAHRWHSIRSVSRR